MKPLKKNPTELMGVIRAQLGERRAVRHQQNYFFCFASVWHLYSHIFLFSSSAHFFLQSRRIFSFSRAAFLRLLTSSAEQILSDCPML